MSISLKQAIRSPNITIDTPSGTVAYRTIGEGSPVILCNRFRGTLDTWDPKFLLHLAKSHQVITFDYPGIGLSTGTHKKTAQGVAEDVRSFMQALGIKQAAIVGWSYGGLIAQAFAACYPEYTGHLLIIGSNPAGNNATPPEQIFFDRALKPINDFDDELVLFFEPASPQSISAGKKSHKRLQLRKQDLDIPVTPDQFGNYRSGAEDFAADLLGIREILQSTTIPFLVVMGDHDPSFPVENWFPLVKHSNSLQLIIISRAGHGPQHQYPKLVSGYMKKFMAETGKSPSNGKHLKTKNK